MKHFNILLFLLTVLSLSLDAQKTTINNMQKSALRTSDVIKQGSEVKGYYFFYVSDKIDRKTNHIWISLCILTLEMIRF